MNEQLKQAAQATPEPAIDDDDLLGIIAGIRDTMHRLAPGLAEVELLQAVGGPSEVPAYVEAVVKALTATPEPVGEPVAWRYKIPTHGGGTAWTHTRPQPECLIEAQPLYTHPAPGVPEVHKIDVGFRWDGDAQQHIPSMVIEFEPVKAGDPTDAKGWRDRDALAAMLAAAQAKGGEHD